jgi:signal transduction histidine kinase/ligand-binding sensor domain-containing protein
VKNARFLSLTRRFASLAVFLLAATSSILPLAAVPASNNPVWFARSWRTEEGLPNNTISGIAQTSDGFLWVATPVSLQRFDGFDFEDVPCTNFVPEPNRGVLAMTPSRGGGLWLAMDRGPIVRLGSGKPQIFTAQDGLPDRTAQRLAEDANGTLWIAYRGGAVCRIRDGKVTAFGNDAGVPRSLVYSLAVDSQNQVWLAEGTNLYHFANEKFVRVLEAAEPIGAITAAHNGGLWLCTGSHLCRYSNDLQDVGTFDLGPADNAVDFLLENRSGAVWIGTTFNGLTRFDGSHFESVPTSSRGIGILMEDAEGNLWVGMRAGGLDRVRMRPVQLELQEAGLPFEPLQSVTEATDGMLWGATENGVLVHRDGTGNWSVVPTPAGGVMCVAAGRSNSVWVGTLNRQLFCWDNGKFQTWGRAEGLSGRILHCLLVASNGDVWIGGPATEIQYLRAGKIESLKLERDSGAVRTMTEDTAGNVWIGTARGALLCASPGNDVLIDETERLGLQAMSIRTVQAASDGSVWIGYAGWGIGRLKDGHLARMSTAQGLDDDFISQIIFDERGSVWYAGDRGVFRLRQQEAEDVFAGRAARVQSIRYGKGEGLPVLQAMSGSSPGAVRSRDGHLWMTMKTALAVIDPKRLRESSISPPVVITGMTVDGELRGWNPGILSHITNKSGTMGVTNPVDLERSEAILELPPGHRRIQFTFTALNFSAPEDLRFRYMLESADDRWIDGSKREADYSRLPWGNYRFRVAACNSSGIWSDLPAVVVFVVKPFFWQTWWFRVMAAAVFICVFVGIGRYVSFRRLRAKLRLLEQQAVVSRERARIARDIHDDLGTRLSEITLLSELALQDHSQREKGQEHIRHISVTARQATDSLDEIVWAANPRNDTLPDLIGYIGQFAQQFLHMAGINCRLELPDQPPKWPLSAEVRHNLFLVTKEALNNVVRHAHAREVCIRVNITEDSLNMTIEDDGKGFEPDRTHPSADGVRNMHQRMETIGGDCGITSRQGAGTIITLTLPRQQGRN